VSGCAARFDESLRESLEPAALARALAPRGSFTDPYLRTAMKRFQCRRRPHSDARRPA
jgi:hypothetical protein